MNIVYFGTSEFAVPSLRALVGSRHKVSAVVTQPDKKRGRLLKVSPPPTKVLALAHSIPVFQPVNASSAESVDFLNSLNADLFVVVSFGQILRGKVLSIPKHYAINLHGSLLPKYRGAAPTNWAIINGDKVSGVTIMRLNEKMDEGDIILKREIGIESEDTNITLTEKLAEIGSEALLNSIDSIEKGSAGFEEQDDMAATYAPKLKKDDGLIKWGEPSAVICNKVRGFLPWPGAYTCYEKKTLKILKTSIIKMDGVNNAQPGEVVDIIAGKGLVVATGSEGIVITHLQLEGKKILDADSFLRGHRIPKGYIFR